ncbi:bacillithiol biosynthesis cysteine-adding enzyme BshC [Bacillus sp. SCS-151]|uniref:bacillithiol biosynthesis cysteine-adding enzyme BshC n=1 Tax=Nanhaiella sioensis TaxID=3115293 RepID=UPI00397CD4F7
MEVNDLFLPSLNKFATDYMGNSKECHQFFHYNIHDATVYEQRKDELASRRFQRERLVKHLLRYHSKFQHNDKSKQHIEKLLDQNSLVVIGGQQAGLLTGPLYTIHKILTIIQTAKQQEKELNVPVLPVFWIAGEDHDFDEINHQYVETESGMKKKSYNRHNTNKQMVSDIHIDKHLCEQWIQEIIQSYGESNYTHEILSMLKQSLHDTETVVDFFAQILITLFADEGLIVVNSASPDLREIESEFFHHLIYNNSQLAEAVSMQQHVLEEVGYNKVLDVNINSSNLFYQYNENRVLLERDGAEGYFKGKNNEVKISFDELIQIAESSPHLLSNNVVTRPLMQEYLFPTLAFIAGPGELAYWGELKNAFSLFDFKMPPIIPRANITIVDRTITSDLEKLNIPIDDVLQGNLLSYRDDWVKTELKYDFESIINNAKEEVEQIHQQIRRKATEVDANLHSVLVKNAQLIQSQFEFVSTLINRSIETKHEVTLKKFQRIENCLRPNHLPQERVWNIFYFLNKYGFGFMQQLVNAPIKYNGNHQLIYL